MSISAFSQTSKMLSVVRTKGTKIYTTPTQNSSDIHHLNFGDKVILVKDFASAIVEVDKSMGYWVQVQFNQFTGFVFRNDLSNSVIINEIEGDYAIITTNSGSLAEINYNPDLQYYAIIQQNSKQEIEKVTVDFRILLSPEGKEQVVITSSSEYPTLFLFGSSRKLRSRWFEYYSLSDSQRQLYAKNDSVPKTIRLIDNRVSLYTELKWAPKTDKELSYAQLLVKEEVDNKRTQKLFPLLDYKPLDQYEYPIYLEWCGDLDGDQRADFLIQFGDILKHYDLYLSGSAGKNKLLEKVASWNAAVQL